MHEPSTLVIVITVSSCYLFFFFNDTATTEIYTLSLHDALPISGRARRRRACAERSRSPRRSRAPRGRAVRTDRKSTRLNSSHSQISYAVFCLKKKKSLIPIDTSNAQADQYHPPNQFPSPTTRET